MAADWLFTLSDCCFRVSPILSQITNDNLKKELRSFFNDWNDPNHPAWYEDFCPDMVDHGLNHARNLFELSARFFHGNEPIKKLNQFEVFCFIHAVWLHDIGLSKTFFTISSTEEFTDFRNFMKQNGIDYPGISHEMVKTEGWVRKHHSFISKYLIENRSEEILPHSGKNNEVFLEILGNICAYHSSKTKINPTHPVKKEKEIIGVPLSEKYPDGIIVCNYNKTAYNVHVPLLAGLLRFIDGCDQSKKRIITPKITACLKRRNLSESLKLKDQIQKRFESIGSEFFTAKWNEIARKVEGNQDTKKNKEDFTTELEEQSIYDCSEKIKEYYRLRTDSQTEFDYKKGIEDVFFDRDSIIVVTKRDSNIEDRDKFKNDLDLDRKLFFSILCSTFTDAKEYPCRFETSDDKIDHDILNPAKEMFFNFHIDWENQYRVTIKENPSAVLSIPTINGEKLLPHLIYFNNISMDTNFHNIKLVVDEGKFEVREDIKIFTRPFFDKMKDNQDCAKGNFFNGKNVRLKSFTKDSDDTVFHVERVDYYDYARTNLVLDKKDGHQKSLRDKIHGSWCLEPLELSPLGNNLGINYLIFDCRGQLIFKERAAVAFLQGAFEPSSSGTVEELDSRCYGDKFFFAKAMNGILAPGQRSFRETEEEIGLNAEDILGHPIFLGITRDLIRGGEPEMFFFAQAKIPFIQIENKWKRAPDRRESSKILAYNFKGYGLDANKITSDTEKEKLKGVITQFIEEYHLIGSDGHIKSHTLLANLALWYRYKIT